MGLKKSKGNMYPWVTHTHAHLGGECPHKCSYCYVANPRYGRPSKYQGELRLIDDEFDVNYGSGKTIFIENCNDMFCKEVPVEFIYKIYEHCYRYPDNVYVFQTKNPQRIIERPPALGVFKYMIGTTIESNRHYPEIMGNAPTPTDRINAMIGIKRLDKNIKTFLTVEPVLDFDVDDLALKISLVNPDFLNLGADSKGHNLPEPSIDKIERLVDKLKEYGIELREKHNLERIRKIKK